MKKLKNILILSAGRRVELVQSFISEIASRNLDSKVLTADIRPEISAACHFVDKSIRVPKVSANNYIDFLLEICKKERVGIIIPTIDLELLLLAINRPRFEQEDIDIIISDESFIEVCRDKRRTAQFFSEIGIDSPKIYLPNQIKYPCFSKPYDGSCSVGAHIIKDEKSLPKALVADPKNIFMEYIDSSYDEFTVDAYYDRHGNLACYVPRQRLETRGGEVSKGVTRRNSVYSFLKKPLNLIKGARGCITLQLFYNAKIEKFAAIEINPRFGGGFPLSYSAGANYPGWIIDEYLLEKEIQYLDSWNANLLMLRYDSKVLVQSYED